MKNCALYSSERLQFFCEFKVLASIKPLLELISHLFYPLGFHFHDARIFFCYSFSIPEWKGEQVFNAIFSHQDIYRSGKATMQKSMKQVFEREKSFAFFPLFLLALSLILTSLFWDFSGYVVGTNIWDGHGPLSDRGTQFCSETLLFLSVPLR